MARIVRGVQSKGVCALYGPVMSIGCRMISCKSDKPNICDIAKKKKVKKFKGQEVKKPLVSMWENPFCKKKKPCPDPRFDDLYYCESDKAKRLYWQTWADCPKLVIKPKKVCVNIKTSVPRRRRKPKIIDYGSDVCPDKSKCPLIPNICHKKATCPLNCLKGGIPTGCKKPLTPYPSFSECLRKKPRKVRYRECECLRVPLLCEIWAEWRKREALRKS